MEVTIWGHLIKENKMEQDICIIIVVTHIMENFLMTKNMVTGRKKCLMVVLITDNINMIKKMEMV